VAWEGWEGEEGTVRGCKGGIDPRSLFLFPAAPGGNSFSALLCMDGMGGGKCLDIIDVFLFLFGIAVFCKDILSG
jgi:hypothetical protein